MADTVQSWAGGLVDTAAPPVRKTGLRTLHAAPLDHRISDVPAADRHHRGAWSSIRRFYSIYLSMLNKAQTRFIGLVEFHVSAVARRVLDGGPAVGDLRALRRVLQSPDRPHHRASRSTTCRAKGQRKWRGMLLVPWVIPLALSSLGWWWLFDPTHSAFNWLLKRLGFEGNPLAQRSLSGRVSRSSWSMSGTARRSS